ncbi:MAG: glycosyltransferase family 4 protein [Ilumatobacteraceae bacterium]
MQSRWVRDDSLRVGEASMTRIAVNVLWCVPGEVGGSEQYLVRQLLGLHEAVGGEFSLEVYAPRGFSRAHPELARIAAIHESRSDERSRPRRVWHEATWFASRARGAGVVHHGGGTVPPRSPHPAVLTIHDLQYLVFPQYFSRIKLRYLTARMPASVRRARHIAVPSAYVQRTVVERLGVPLNDVSVVRHGIEPSLGTNCTPERELRARLDLSADHVLVYPAITHPHKNHRFLLDVMAGPLRDTRTQLVFAGGAGRAQDDVRRSVAALRLTDRVKLVGRLGDRDRDGLLAMAAALVFPSSYEGFGAPVIEAMALGAPVVASNLTALPEVVGDAGYAIDLDVQAWADAISDAIERREMWQGRGRLRAATYRAVDSGSDLAAVYRRASE